MLEHLQTTKKKNKTVASKFVFGSVENMTGQEENAGYQHFLLFPTMFSKGFFLTVIKSRDCLVKLLNWAW